MGGIKVGYKGMSKDMECRNVKFEIGKTYFIENRKVKSTDCVVDLHREDNSLELCSEHVFHYCDKLIHVHPFYRNNGDNRYFEIQILGAYKNNSDKSCTTSFRIIKELSKEEHDRIVRRERYDMVETDMRINELFALQQEFPEIIIGGSVGLYLSGYWLDRFANWTGDIDIITPYWVDLSIHKGVEQTDDEKNSGNDFDDTFSAFGLKVDVRVDPHHRYEVVSYKGRNFKVVPPISTIAAKTRYALQKGGQKHLQDVMELMSQNKVANV